jgi:hypothetical protein
MPLTQINPVQAAREAMRRFDYAAAKTILIEECERDTHKFELGRIANLIEIGMIPEAIDALNRMEGSLEDYKAAPPADEPIGCTVQQLNAFPKGRW